MDFGTPHSPALVEGTVLASVDPPEITYGLQMARCIYAAGEGNNPLLSSSQLEAIIYACQSFQETLRDDNDQEVTYGFYLGKKIKQKLNNTLILNWPHIGFV